MGEDNSLQALMLAEKLAAYTIGYCREHTPKSRNDTLAFVGLAYMFGIVYAKDLLTMDDALFILGQVEEHGMGAVDAIKNHYKERL